MEKSVYMAKNLSSFQFCYLFKCMIYSADIGKQYVSKHMRVSTQRRLKCRLIEKLPRLFAGSTVAQLVERMLFFVIDLIKVRS